MVSAWLYKDSEEDGRLKHQFTPNQPVSLVELKEIGVLHWTHNPDTEMEAVDKIAEERNYKSRDKIEISKEKLANYEEKLKMFFTEHLHDDEEIRYILAGSGYFDIRNKMDQWVRIHCSKGDMIILPAGSYHRFILDESNYIHAMRLFKEVPSWAPINRSEEADKHPIRKEYLDCLKQEDEDEEDETASKKIKLSTECNDTNSQEDVVAAKFVEE